MPWSGHGQDMLAQRWHGRCGLGCARRPRLCHALMHLAGKHSEGMHHHTHSDGMGGGHTVHTSEHGGEPEGPHDHKNLESVKQGMDHFFNEEKGEGEDDWGGKDGQKKSSEASSNMPAAISDLARIIMARSSYSDMLSIAWP